MTLEVEIGVHDLLLYCGYVSLVVYAYCHIFHGIYWMGLTASLVVVGFVGFIIFYFRIERAPLEHVKGVFADLAASETNGISQNLNAVGRDSSPGRNGVVVVGHRGAGLDAPENTLKAFEECKKRNCHFVEFDVALTKCNTPVVFHDDDLRRMTGDEHTQKINEMTWEELQEIDLAKSHPLGDKFKGARVPKFSDIIEFLVKNNMKFFIDLKDTNEQIVDAVCSAYKQYDMYHLAVVSSFYANVVYKIRQRDPKIIGCMAWRPEAFGSKVWSADGQNKERRYPFFLQDWLASVWDHFHDWLLVRFLWWFLGLSAVLLHKDAISKHELHSWHRRGVRVFVWTVNNVSEKTHFKENIRVSYLTDTLDGGDGPRTPPRPIARN